MKNNIVNNKVSDVAVAEIMYAEAEALNNINDNSAQSWLANHLDQCIKEEKLKALLLDDDVSILRSISSNNVRVCVGNSNDINKLSDIESLIELISENEYLPKIAIDNFSNVMDVEIPKGSYLKEVFHDIINIKSLSYS